MGIKLRCLVYRNILDMKFVFISNIFFDLYESSYKTGGVDETRTRDPRRDRPVF